MCQIVFKTMRLMIKFQENKVLSSEICLLDYPDIEASALVLEREKVFIFYTTTL